MKIIKLAIFHLVLSTIWVNAFAQSNQNFKIDSIQHKIESQIPDTLKVKAILELVKIYAAEDIKSAIEKCSLAIILAEKIKFKDGLTNAYGYMAYLHEQQGNQDVALQYYRKALDISVERVDKKNQAIVLNNIAAIYKDQGKIEDALQYHFQSLGLRIESGHSSGAATSYNNIGLIYASQGRIPEALENYLNALQLFEEIAEMEGLSTVFQNIASVYKDQGENNKALEYYRKSLDIEITRGYKYDLAYALNGMGNIFEENGNLDSANYYYLKALDLRKEIEDKQGAAYTLKNLGNIHLKRAEFNAARLHLEKSLNIFKELKDPLGMTIAGNLYGSVLFNMGLYAESEIFLQQSLKQAQELGFPIHIRNAAFQLYQLHRKQGLWKNALDAQELYLQMKDSIQNENNRKSAIQLQFQYEYDKKTTQLKLEHESQSKIAAAEISRQKVIRNTLLTGLIIVIVFALIFFRQRNKISNEKKRSEELLLNILPAETAEELKATGSAKARHFDTVTVLFTDFKNFTQLSEQLNAQELINEINYCYSAFDQIISKYGIEKIKTIGDSYMCAGGLPIANTSHASDVAHAALEIRDFMLREKEQRKSTGKMVFELRIGCHTGPVVAGIVGIKKFAYDIWGDTVNIASRMEATCEAGKINISGATYHLIQNKFICSYRGKIEAKNKGEIDMYFLENAVL